MRTTLDLSDPVFRRLKSRAALEGLSLKDLIARYVTAGLQRAEAQEGSVASDAVAREVRHVTVFDVLQDGCGVAHSGHGDLATHARHMEGFGRE